MKAKEMISLNSGRAEFSADMGLEERLEKLTSSEMQTVKGRCTLMDSSSSSEVNTCITESCKPFDWTCIECPDCGQECVPYMYSCTFECWTEDCYQERCWTWT